MACIKLCNYFFLCRISQLLSFATTLCSQESSTLGLPDFPLDSLSAAVQILVCAYTCAVKMNELKIS